MNIRTRLKDFLSKIDVSEGTFEKKIGLSKGYVSNVGDSIRKTSLDKIREKYPQLNTNWLLTGEGNMLLGANELKPDIRNSIPMYNFPASASNIEMYGDASDVKIVGHLNIPGATKDSFALPVHGHSMYPTLENGAWCILRPIKDRSSIVWGEIYYIEWGDYRMFKRLLLGEEKDELILWSDNQEEKIADRPKYAPITIKKKEIRRLCLLTDILKKPNY